MSDRALKEHKASQIHNRFFKSDLKPMTNDQVSKDPDMMLFFKIRKKVKSYIAKSDTSLENNKLPSEKYSYISQGVADVRKLYIECSLKKEKMMRQIYNGVEAVKKYSFGNCFEYAILTLDALGEAGFKGSAYIYPLHFKMRTTVNAIFESYR